MTRAKDLIFRLFGDVGADTIQKTWAQIEYTGYCCIRMLSPASGIVAVTPEGVDDVTLDCGSRRELHQVKCRDESQLPWTIAEVLPILCGQYHRRKAFNEPCEFHFVSDHVSDSKTQYRPGISYGPLSRLRYLLDILHAGQKLTVPESTEFQELEKDIVSRIVELMHAEHNEIVNEGLACELLKNTWIETDSIHIRNKPPHDELSSVLVQSFPGQMPCTIPQLARTYERILLLIIGKIIKENEFEARTLRRQDILDCRSGAISPEYGLPDLDQLPGNSTAEKKALYAGFDVTELPVFVLQMMRANEKRRGFEMIGLTEEIRDLYLDLITWQHECRQALSREHSDQQIGPHVLEKMRAQMLTHLQNHLPNKGLNESFCHGLVWDATNECHLWWHRIGSPTNR